ncbi:hypothetical protein E0493_21645 [Roseomonas sp. M0104]|uniref:DEAD/DEAH box helicase n=1 Tax=Teichococcus coralli TaxID=2545983 RepID=A0A845BG17_9PROT|nr:SNF2-related protein [Pseudoroseomonas coralli]MXP65955.1 hypothetical protein [Pseudoroseomonas coralli]
MAIYHVSAQPQQIGFAISVTRSGLLGFGRSAIPPVDWSDAQGPGAALMALLLRESRVTPEGDSALLPHAEAARLLEHDARLLGLPARCPYQLRLTAEGQVSLPGFAVRTEWLDDRGTLAFGLRRTGAFLSNGTHRFLVDDPLFSLLEEVERLNAASAVTSGSGDARASLDTRMAAFAAFKRALEAATGDAEADRYLDELVVYRATGLGVDTAQAADGGDAFLPLLLGDAPPDVAVMASPSEAAENEEIAPRRQRLLPRGHAERLATSLFPEQGARPHYRLGAGVYAVLDPPVAAALQVLQSVNHADQATRAEFRRDPRAFLLEAVEAAGGEGGIIGGGTLLDGPVAEEGFGERVLGVRLWTGKQLSFRIPVSRQWFPEEEGGEVYTIEPPGADQPLMVKRSEVSALQTAVAQAVAAGHPTASFGGREVPLSSDFIQTVMGLAGMVRPTEPGSGATENPRDEKANPAKEPVLALGVAENDEMVTFRAHLREGVGNGWRCDLDAMATPPMPHQRDGIAWLESAYQSGLPGVLLADDMGLGKTYQVLAFLRAVRRRVLPEDRRRPILVVAPKTLLGEWREQIALHLGGEGLGRSVFAYEAGLKDLTRTARPDPSAPGKRTLDTDRLREADWVLTTYETLRDYQISFGRVHFEVAVYDEAQKLKGLTSLVNNAAKGLSKVDFTILMTGTPIENSALDLWALMDIAWPGFLEASGRDFAARYIRSPAPDDLTRLKRRLVEPQELNGTLFPPVLLRRFKDDVLEGLPPKAVKVWEREMPPEQAAAYDMVLEEMRTGRLLALEALGRLRAVCLHPRLAMPTSAAEHGAFIARSARFSALFEMLAEVHRQGEKALVFVDIIEAQRVLAALIRHRFSMPRMPDVINGATDGAVRTRIKREFQERLGFDVLLLGPRAAGFGLTLTAANHVFHLNRWWNPAVEDQCSDRVYRIGQQRPVTIHLPKAVHPGHREASFDCQLDELLAGKRAASREIVVPTAMGEDDFQRLFSRLSGQNTRADPELLRSLDLMDWASFEAWVAEEVRATGQIVHATPRSGDGGADVVAQPAPGSALRPILCQCKHRARGADGEVGEEAVHDLLRARLRWSGLTANPVLVAVTNGVFTLAARNLAAEHAILLFDRRCLSDLRPAIQREGGVKCATERRGRL